MTAVLLNVRNRFRAAVQAARRGVPLDRIAWGDPPVPVDTVRIGALGQKIQHRAEPALRRGEHDADRRLVVELASHAPDRITGERFDGLPVLEEPVANARELFLRDRLHRANRIFANATGELRRAENRRLRRNSCEYIVAVGQIVRALRRAADPARIEQPGALAVATIEG